MSNSTGFEDFCGGTFWDKELTWEGDKPRFTDCFMQTALVWGPCGFFTIMLMFYIPYLYHYENDKSIKMSWLNNAKTITSLALIIVTCVDVIQGAQQWSQNGADPVYFVSPFILMIFLAIALVIFRVELRKGFITSGVLWAFYFSLLVCGIIPFYMKIINKQDQGEIEDIFRFVTFYIYYGFLLGQFTLFCFAEHSQESIIVSETGKYASPEVFASFFSKVTFWWLNGLVMTAYRKTLTDTDLWSPHPSDLSQNVTPPFQNQWNKQVVKYQSGQSKHENVRKIKRQASRKLSTRSPDAMSEKTPLLSQPSVYEEQRVTIKKSEQKEGTPSLTLAIAREFGPMLLVAHACKLVCDLLTFVGPILQGALISYTEDPNAQQWKGYLYAFLFFVTTVANSFFFQQLFHIGMRQGMRLKASLISVIYQKALSMSNEARKTTTVGEIVNLMSVDAQRLQDVFGYLWMFWSAPLQIVIAVYLLWQQLGPSVLAGLALMILLGPVNGVIGTIQRKLQIAQMKQKDGRIKIMNEVLNGMKVLKLYAWELSFKDKVNLIRDAELDTLQKYAYLQAVSTFTWTCAPFLVTLVCFMTFTLTGGVLDANKAFVSLSLLNILRFPINLLPMMITYFVTAMVSVKRISTFLMNGDIDFDNVHHDPMAEHPMTIRNGNFAWGTTKDDLPVLKNVNLEVPQGKLVAVVGGVGSGKSSLLSAFLGEMEKSSGYVNLRGHVAYVAQQAWIQNATLRDNILFGHEFDPIRYDNVLEACALKPDLEILTAGDMTEIGEKGINLSGGQKQRVALARAVYNNADIYMLDDPLSAVDSHVGKHIFQNVVSNQTGLLKGKTRVLVTHGVQWLPKVDRIIVLTDGIVSEEGTYEELLSHDGAFAQFLKTYLTNEESESESEEDEELKAQKRQILERVASVASDPSVLKRSAQGSDRGSDRGSSTVRRRKNKTKSMMSDEKGGVKSQISRQKSKAETEMKKEKAGEKLIEVEKSMEGGVKWSVFLSYIKALGTVYASLWFVFFLGYQLVSVFSSVWLTFWTEDPLIANASLVGTPEYTKKSNMYLGVYGGLGAGQALFVMLYAIVTALSMVRAARLLHENMLSNIFRSPMSFFDTTPIGRILNRFSRDIETIDNLLPSLIRSWMNTFFSVIATVVVISYSTPIFLSVVVPLAILYYFVQRFYIPTSRQLKRIESTTRSPIYVHFSETITGAATIRAYGVENRFISHSEGLVDHNLAFYFTGVASNRWLGFRLEFLGALIVLSAAMFAVLGKDSLSGGLVGLSISYALQVTQALNWMVRMTSDLETNVVSVERVKEYSETPTEADWYIESSKPPPAWPDEGKVAFESYSTRYRPGLDLVLRGITANIGAQEKIGIVGRTGAGKSSMTVAMFRLIEAAGGSIQIDGIPINILGLHQLRSKLTILPQDPVLFSGTLRMNLDPFDRFTDEALWNALEHAHLKKFVKSLPAQLEYECGEGGQNLSVGQRQLVCLARALLRKTRILILDEATAAVDLETDELIQKTIRSEFKDCTILTIAHRLNTVLDSDRVMVLDNGRIAEFDSPEELLANKDTIFYSMCRNAGLVSSQPSARNDNDDLELQGAAGGDMAPDRNGSRTNSGSKDD